MNRSQYIERLEAKLQEWNADMGKLLAKARAKRAEGLAALQTQVEALHEKRELVTRRLAALKDQTGDGWDTMKDEIERTWATLRDEGKRLWHALEKPTPANTPS